MFTKLYMIYNQLAYLFQQLLIAEGSRRSYNGSGCSSYVLKMLWNLKVKGVTGENPASGSYACITTGFLEYVTASLMDGQGPGW